MNGVNPNIHLNSVELRYSFTPLRVCLLFQSIMTDDLGLLEFGYVLTLGSVVFVLALIGKRRSPDPLQPQHPTAPLSTPAPKSTPAPQDSAAPQDSTAQEIAALQQQCLRLREALQQQKNQTRADFQESTFEQLQSLLTNFPSARKMAQSRPDLPAKNLTALFTPLENLLHSWGIEPIGEAWGQVAYDPQVHQSDGDNLTPGEMVYVRFVGYRQSDRILCPARVSRTLPGGAQ
jgi:molecular chaperone GrpE (heat shock protein)